MKMPVRVNIAGLPEEVQSLADALDIAFPFAFHWSGTGNAGANGKISVDGVCVPLVAKTRSQKL